MKLFLVGALFALVALTAAHPEGGYDGGSRPAKSRCLVKWEECMAGKNQPTGEECDEEITQKHQCVKPKAGGAKTGGGKSGGGGGAGDYDLVLTRESKDDDHQEDISRLKLKSKDRSNLEFGNKDRVASGAESIRQMSETDGGGGGNNGGGRRAGGGSRRGSQEMDANEDRGNRKSGGRGGGGGGGGGGRRSDERYENEGGQGRSTAFAGMDKVSFDKGHEDMMKQQSASDLELEKEDSHKRDKTSHKKESMMKRNP